MARSTLLACLLVGLAYRTTSMMLQASAQRATAGVCPGLKNIARKLQAQASDPAAQASGCQALGSCVLISSKIDQYFAGQAGLIEAAISAQGRFPEDKQVQISCTRAVPNAILFNHANGLRAGRLGGLNLTFAAYRRWIDDPDVTLLGGAIGAYFDFVNENRAIARELGGIQLLITNIKNNFHGPYSDWAYEPVKESLFGLSSGCWRNQDICHEEGFVDLAVRLMSEHTNETKIAEETLQAIKALIYYSDDYRREFAEKGGGRALVAVLEGNQGDRGAVSLVCETMYYLVGPGIMAEAYGGGLRKVPFDAAVQAQLASEGAVEALLDTILGRKQRAHFEHGAFSFNVDLAYNADSLCLQAAQVMISKSGHFNAEVMLQAGLAEDLGGKLRTGSLNAVARVQACLLLRTLAKTNSSVVTC